HVSFPGFKTMSDPRIAAVKSRIPVFPDFPKPGIQFYDIFSLFQQPSLCSDVVDLFYEHFISKYPSTKIDAVLGLDARGFLFAPPLAEKFKANFVPVRKSGKLPGVVASCSYSLEYGEAEIEIQEHALQKGQNVIIVDDLMATGGTMSTACLLAQNMNVNVIQCQCVIELTGLNGVKQLPEGTDMYSIVQFE
uniref:Adenine phosphoribosyltransferase n=1 Tax=Ciona savignyi TaxID=51511 RepID=H2ZE88_CIOSA